MIPANALPLAELAPSSSPTDLPERRRIGGVDILAAKSDAAARLLGERLEAKLYTPVGFANAHCLNLAADDATFRSALEEFLLLPDGVGVDLASRLLFGGSFPDNLNGTDFVPSLLASLDRPVRVALIGAAEGIVERAALAFAAAHPRHVFLPVAHGFVPEGPETELMLARLRAARADIVLVALGMPRQEMFIARHLTPRHATLAIAVGALLDFTAGEVPRAPPAVRRLRLEWVYRLLIEPSRLWRRYLLGNPRFMLRILAERRTARRRRSVPS